jgi:hypothetical protein
MKSLSCSIALAFALASSANACSWAIGYFHQVTELRGRVVGKDLRPANFRWLRQSFAVSKAELTLFRYKHPYQLTKELEVRRITADDDGRFDFGQLQTGHSTLRIAAGTHEEYFDVEITGSVKPTDSILIDISPVTPDCKGGHEFNVKGKAS